ncbi:MAG: hypothetical protein U5L96_14900 [Owenweeksia sp.]|nr:hypothetical protein [Owenweeksia sp.]
MEAICLFSDLSTFNPNADEVYHGFDYGIGLHVTKYLSSVWGIKGQATYGTLSGSNGAEAPNTVIRFENDPYFDYNLNAVVNLSALALKGKQKDRKFSALVSAGLGMSKF